MALERLLNDHVLEIQTTVPLSGAYKSARLSPYKNSYQHSRFLTTRLDSTLDPLSRLDICMVYAAGLIMACLVVERLPPSQVRADRMPCQ